MSRFVAQEQMRRQQATTPQALTDTEARKAALRPCINRQTSQIKRWLS